MPIGENPKSQYLSPKQYQNSNVPNEDAGEAGFEFWSFDIVSCVQPLSATLGFEDLRWGFESETFSRTVIEPVFDLF